MERILRLQINGTKINVELSEDFITEERLIEVCSIPKNAIVRITHKDGDQLIGCRASILPVDRFLLPDGWEKIEFTVEYQLEPRILQLRMNGGCIYIYHDKNFVTNDYIMSTFSFPENSVVRLTYYGDNGQKCVCQPSHLPEPCFLLPDGWEKYEYTVGYRLDPTHYQEHKPRKSLQLRMEGTYMLAEQYEDYVTEDWIKKVFGIPKNSVVRLTYYGDDDQLCVCQTSNLPEPCFLLPEGWEEIEFIVECQKDPNDQQEHKPRKSLQLRMDGTYMLAAQYEDFVTEQWIKKMFGIPKDSVVRLTYYGEDDQLCVCQTSHLPEPCFLLPDGWEEIEYFVECQMNPGHHQEKNPINEDERK